MDCDRPTVPFSVYHVEQKYLNKSRSIFATRVRRILGVISFFFKDTATTEIYTLSLHDALPISDLSSLASRTLAYHWNGTAWTRSPRSEEHTSELQSQSNLVCRLLLEKKNG